ncbi:MAG: nucleotide sugar dehydrogenase [Firmicutes bacterium]|nr:nucleotide sugar dehydrogenase [Bacillota bacterium]
MNHNVYEIKQKILSHTADVAILGLGYVGLPIAVEVARQGFRVTGIDVDASKVAMINKKLSYIPDVLGADLREVVKNKKFLATEDTSVLSSCDVIIICVPTPLTKTREPDLSFVMNAVKHCASHLRRGQLITLESTTYPGATAGEILNLLQKNSDLQVGDDFFLAFSPERVDPGNVTYNTKNITKVVGGITSQCTELASLFYKEIVDYTIMVSSPTAAEMTKVFENVYRSVNIALVNELMFICDQMGLDVWEIIDAAGTKPFGIQTFYPGPGVGGHCIPIDPHFLSWKAKEFGYSTRLIEIAAQINIEAVEYVVRKLERMLGEKNQSLRGAKILLMGVAYKRDIGDCRESPAINIMSRIISLGADVLYFDPYVPEVRLSSDLSVSCSTLTSRVLSSVDCVLITTDHSCINYQWIVDQAQVVIDTRNVTKSLQKGQEKVILI